MTARRQPRALLFVFDGGTGLGHLRRLSIIARHLQGDFACLIVTGHRAAADWFVPAECEYVRIPSWDSLLAEKATYWGREPFMRIAPGSATRFRREMLQGIVETFKPDVMVVDHLPLGMREELASIVAKTDCLKYLVTRAVQNETEDLDRLLLGGRARKAIERYYSRIFVAMDERVFDLRDRYPLFDDVGDKVCGVGYVAEEVSAKTAERHRRQRGVPPDGIWAVASAGGGQHGETLIEESCKLAIDRPSIAFDVVLGPRSNLCLPDGEGQPDFPSNLRVHSHALDLAEWHAAADIVISSGGYNSLLEALQGWAQILCIPSRKDERDEQYVHAAKLARFATIKVDTDVAHLPSMFARAVADLRNGRKPDDRRALDYSGAANIKRILHRDLNFGPSDGGGSR